MFIRKGWSQQRLGHALHLPQNHSQEHGRDPGQQGQQNQPGPLAAGYSCSHQALCILLLQAPGCLHTYISLVRIPQLLNKYQITEAFAECGPQGLIDDPAASAHASELAVLYAQQPA